ncbi:MAG: hypothetical protein R3279_09820, partial [Putridiphycobacter sp.]|nr:hypothetical protein [Putridiphycobacter sp.]
MKFVSAQVILITYLFNFSYSQAQCVDTNNIYTFVYNNTTYELVSELKTWTDAAACAVARGGVLVEINDAGEQNAIFNEILTNGGITYGTSVPTIPMGNGNGSFVWL